MSTGAGAGLDPHLIDDRAAMELASGCTSRVDLARLRDAMRELAGRSADQLLASLREPHADFEIRYAAGTLLGLLGDRHCRIENRLHWVRDVTFDEDRSQVRSSSGPRVMASLRNLVTASSASTTPPTSPKHYDITHGTPSGPSQHSPPAEI